MRMRMRMGMGMRMKVRRTAGLLGACAAAAALALATPGTAQAAHGVLFIDGAPNHDPSGCFPLGDFAPSEVANFTDGVAWVWDGANCDGRVVHPILPGRTAIGHGRSLFIE
ncbi:hypothetical protein [Streptomyces lavendulae]|uniref:hypothetical protein n=1 Tax=Streptomyces lavendulae TaxID=1914 RepID=UPI0024A5290D|nr:hypothetical protein [Streptomyces lavendulae]GLX21743.1 hypothetical protein Slala01_53870 [Streptomyces lavendulae subsp. lavendulae]GLX28376.1 hypothetical protein Slala02_41960 [Streptomyces lavendulae subsp. lavendulae]